MKIKKTTQPFMENLHSVRSPRFVVETLSEIGNSLTLSKNVVLKAKQTALSLYNAVSESSPLIFDYEFSFKIDMRNNIVAPAIRFTNFTFYGLPSQFTAVATDNKKQLRRLRAITNILGYFKILTPQNNSLLTQLFRTTFDKHYMLPLQVGIDLQEERSILKVYYWCDGRYKLPQKDRRKILCKILASPPFCYDAKTHLHNRNISFFGVDFWDDCPSLKIYTTYDDFKNFFDDLEATGVKTQHLRRIIHKNQRYISDTPLICFCLKNNKLAIKKAELFIRREFLYINRHTKNITSAFLSCLPNPIPIDTRLAMYLYRKPYGYAIGKDFLTIYCRFKRIYTDPA